MQVKEKLYNMVLPDSSEKGFGMVLRMELGNLLGGHPISMQLAWGYRGEAAAACWEENIHFGSPGGFDVSLITFHSSKARLGLWGHI